MDNLARHLAKVGSPQVQICEGFGTSTASARALVTGRYFNAELLQVTHRISCPAPGRSSTATKPLDSLSTLRRGPACPFKPSSETVPVPVRPQWGQQSPTAQAFNAVSFECNCGSCQICFVRRLQTATLCRRRPQSLFKIAHSATEDRQRAIACAPQHRLRAAWR